MEAMDITTEEAERLAGQLMPGIDFKATREAPEDVKPGTNPGYFLVARGRGWHIRGASYLDCLYLLKQKRADHCKVCGDKTKYRTWQPEDSNKTLEFWDCPKRHGYWYKDEASTSAPVWKDKK